jgi:hypothetical protein
MPLVARVADQRIEADQLSIEDWAGLVQENRQRWHLMAPCCDQAVVCKVSPLGTRFFSHKSLSTCVYRQESPLHLSAKVAVARAARSAGWKAELEVANIEAGWRADVLISKGKRRIAVEIQTSPIKLDEVQRRQSRYWASGIRGVWLVVPDTLMTEREDLPVFRLISEVESEFSVEFHPPPTPQGWAGNPVKAVSVQSPAPVRLGISDFVNRLMSDKIQWAPWINQVLPVNVYFGLQQCKGCSSMPRFISGVMVRLSKKWPGARDAYLDWGAIYRGARANELLQAIEGLPFEADVVARLQGKSTDGEFFVSQRCPHCGWGLSAPYGMRIKAKDKLWATVPLKISGHWHNYSVHDTDAVPVGWWTRPTNKVTRA